MPTSVKIKFSPSKIRGKEGVIYLQLIHNRKIKLIRTRFGIFSNEWDENAQAVNLIIDSPERTNQLFAIKSGLDAEIHQIKELTRLLEMKGEYSVGELAELYANNSFNGCFFPFIDFTVNQMRKAGRNKSSTVLLTAKRSFERFRAGQDILLTQLDNNLIQKYAHWIQSSGIRKNTLSCYLRTLRAVYNQAVKRGLTTQNFPFANTYTGIDKTVKRAVNEDVIIRLKNLDLSEHPALALARDLFLFSFYMRGISFVDMANLQKTNIKNGYIVYLRSKTRQMLTVKIEPCMQEIIARYAHQTIDDYLLPVYTSHNCDNTSQLRNHNRRLKRISEKLGLEKPLSSYVSRHTWATIALRRGVPIEVISEGMGHENESTTRIYLASLGQSVVDKANAEVINLE
ncbi:MAG: site-specific integrase [Dysgonamonadaceae bacterium]|jgi:site-specific recombinase XerD|nr:site-specific integrase [Dysgonamonadaceae bacterium]